MPKVRKAVLDAPTKCCQGDENSCQLGGKEATAARITAAFSGGFRPGRTDPLWPTRAHPNERITERSQEKCGYCLVALPAKSAAFAALIPWITGATKRIVLLAIRPVASATGINDLVIYAVSVTFSRSIIAP